MTIQIISYFINTDRRKCPTVNNIRYFIQLNSPTDNRHRTRALLPPARNSVDEFQHTFLWCWNIRCIPFIHNHRIHSFGIVLPLYIIYAWCIIVTSRDPYCRYIDKSLIINHHIGQKVALGWALGRYWVRWNNCFVQEVWDSK